jgi:hypothetical protein
MAYSDHELVDTIKCNFGDPNMPDETLQAAVEHRFRQGTPQDRAETLAVLGSALKGEDGILRSDMRKIAPLWLLERRLREVDQQYRRLGR